MHIVIIWQRFLPYHMARIRHARKRLEKLGHCLTAVEVASGDASYDFPVEYSEVEFTRICCFPGTSYHSHAPKEIHRKVLSVLTGLAPDLVFAPATPFPEGMAAVAYRCSSGGRAVMMDDAWARTDLRGPLTRFVKRRIHRNIDAAFVPAPSHRDYFFSVGFPQERIVYGVDVVDNDYFAAGTEAVRGSVGGHRHVLNLPRSYFLFVGRFLQRKGIDTLLDALRTYRERNQEDCWDLVLVGDGPELETMKKRALGMTGVHFAGQRLGDELLSCYAFAKTLIVPSERDPWALVVNEGMASGLPVLVSNSCGAATTLVHEGKNGWTFAARDANGLSRLMHRISTLPDNELKAMGNASRTIIADWSPDRFVDGVLSAIEIPRRQPAGYFSRAAARLWKGRVSVN